jgi:hypothetical protein
VNFDLLLVAHVFSTFFMTGLIWLVQIVHYPSFLFVSEAGFNSFHDFHSRRITWIVAPIMGVELLSAAVLWYTRGGTLWLANFISVCVLWALTGLVSVPIHNRLTHGLSRSDLDQLVKTNWWRTIGWSLRALFLIGFFMLFQLNQK